MRALLRKLIGWDELAIQYAPAVSASEIMSYVCALESEIAELKKRLPVQAKRVSAIGAPTTWEEVQAIYLREENFKENA